MDESADEAMVITRGIYDGQGNKAYTKVSAFVRTSDGWCERFEETAFNTVFEMHTVKNPLRQAGWKKVHFARTEDLGTSIDDPEKEGRVSIVAAK